MVCVMFKALSSNFEWREIPLPIWGCPDLTSDLYVGAPGGPLLPILFSSVQKKKKAHYPTNIPIVNINIAHSERTPVQLSVPSSTSVDNETHHSAQVLAVERILDQRHENRVLIQWKNYPVSKSLGTSGKHATAPTNEEPQPAPSGDPSLPVHSTHQPLFSSSRSPSVTILSIHLVVLLEHRTPTTCLLLQPHQLPTRMSHVQFVK